MLLDLLKTRYSCREFSNRKIDKKIIDYILECGRLSASGGNEQPWKFGVITNEETIKKIAEAASVHYIQPWINDAPLIIVLCTQLLNTVYEAIVMNRFPSFREQIQNIDRDIYSSINMEEHQTKIPGEHMVLAALEHGIYSTWVSSIDCEKVGKLLGLEGYIVSNIIVFGYPKTKKGTTPKKSLDSITFTNDFKNPGYHKSTLTKQLNA